MLGDLKNFGIAVAEDCTKQLSAYINFDILDAIQRSSAKPWLSGTPYSKDACMPDLGLVVIDSTRLQKDLLEAILWWSRVLNKSERFLILLLSLNIGNLELIFHFSSSCPIFQLLMFGCTASFLFSNLLKMCSVRVSQVLVSNLF